MAGYTSVFEVTGCAREISPAVEDGTIVGPNIYSSFGLITMTGGHADVHNLPIAIVLSASAHITPTGVICDGVLHCIRAVRLQLRRDVNLIIYLLYYIHDRHEIRFHTCYRTPRPRIRFSLAPLAYF
jgi:hypothetical protein